MSVLLDTHAWLWWLSSPELLPKKAARTIRESMESYKVLISSLSAWEIAMLCTRGRLELATDYREFIHQTEKLPFVQFITPNNEILIGSVNLPAYEGKDPADRIIVATANHMGATLVTKDEHMLAYRHVRTIWN
ncbi:MAG TPA: type II toxin-antitoxin system VapC family toxin [Turneriella sp.]|nr:type II toxin-antitoxin system VapC family toxin [Turneriella sp.]HNJ65503.1 type II toxin-antitoxin system VapC family toxin [Turneriella sp.]